MAKSNKLPNAKDWPRRHIDDWNTVTFTTYMQEKHRDLFGCEYVPMRSWAVEQGMLGRLIGTRDKVGTHDKAIVRAFIDEAFKTYKPTLQYPGTNFGFIYSYRRNILQRLEAEQAQANAKEERKEQARTWAEKESENIDDVLDWL